MSTPTGPSLCAPTPLPEPNSTIKIGISSCLLGAKVRYDAGHKKNAYITAVLNNYFEFMPFCPEVEIGLGIPRETIRLVEVDNETRCVDTKTETYDVTERLSNVADQQHSWQQDLCGYILKRDSPSCGMERVKMYRNGHPNRNGVGVYAKRLLENYPQLPTEEEGRLEDPHLRENFIQRVYVYSRWKAMCLKEPDLKDLQKFHAQHKYILMSHNQAQEKIIGALLVGSKDFDLSGARNAYLEQMMACLKVIATRKNHVNTLQHIQGYLKNHLDSADKAELGELIAGYGQGLLPLIVPITLLRHHFKKHPNDYITDSYYMAPHPGELMLLNTI